MMDKSSNDGETNKMITDKATINKNRNGGQKPGEIDRSSNDGQMEDKYSNDGQKQ